MSHTKVAHRGGALGLIVCLPVAIAMSTVTTTNQAAAVPSDRPVQLGGIAQDVAVDGDMAYLGVGRRVLVIDSSDPMSPVVVGETPSLPGRIGQVVFDAGLVYVGYGIEIVNTGDETGLALIDVSDPAAPQILSTIETPSRPSGLDASGGFAYVALGIDGLSIVDFRSTAAPVLQGRLEATPGDFVVPERSAAIDVAVEGDFAVLLEVENTSRTFHILRTVDVTDPADPRQLGSYRPDRFPIGVALDGDNAYVAEAGGITVLSLVDRRNPEVIGRLEGLPSDGLDVMGNRLNGNTIVIEGGRAYFFGAPVDLARRVWIADVSSPGSPMVMGDILTHDLSVGLSIDGAHVYVANWGGGGSRDYRGLEIYGSSDPSMPTALGYINRETWHALNVVVDADLAFVAAAGNGLRVVDVRSPDAPRLVGSLDVGGQVADVVVSGELAYLADGSDGAILHVVDVSDPAEPLLITSLDAPAGRAVAMELFGDHLVLAFEDGRLSFWSLTDPRDPQLESTLDFGEHASDLQVSGDFVYVAARAGTGFPNYVRFHVVDASDMAAPRLVESHDLTGSEPFGAPSLAVDAGRLYLPALEVLQVLEIRAGTGPELLGDVALFSPGSGVAIRDGYLYLVEHYSLAVIDVSDPSSPREVVSWRWAALVDATRATGIAFAGDCVFYAHYDAGLLSNCPDLPDLPVPTATGTDDPTAGPSTEPSPVISPTDISLPTSTPSPSVTPGTEPTDIPTAEPATPMVPSPTIESSSTPLPSETHTPVRATPAPTFTSGPPSIVPVYLPLALLEHCPPKDLFTDVVLVIDASTSMRELTTDRRQKVDVAIEAAEVFIDGLRLSPGQDRVAVVTFNEEASTLHRLTDDPLLAKESLNRLRIEAHSRVDLGIARATVELIARGRPAHVRAMVVLSDGKVNQVGADAPGIAARQAQLADITVYVVGMGPSMDERVLREMASSEERYFAAPEPLLIRAIYADLTTRVPCPADAYWGRR